MQRSQRASLATLLLITILAYTFALMFYDNTTALAAFPKISGQEIIQMLDKTGGEMKEIRINGWVKKNKDNEKEFNQEYDHVADQEYNKVDDQAGDQQYDQDDFLILEAILNVDELWKEDQVYQNMHDELSLAGNFPTMGTTYTATIRGKLTTEEMDRIGRELITGFYGKITECNQDADWVSFTGYSNRLGGGMESRYGRFNLNIALRYHTSEGITYIRIGTPVIAIPY